VMDQLVTGPPYVIGMSRCIPRLCLRMFDIVIVVFLVGI
jgi:hypothetical protein